MTESKTDNPAERSKDGLPVARRWRLLASVFLIGHLMAIFGPPLAFQTRGPRGISPSVVAFVWPVERYAQWLYLDRGYAFFAPDPGPSHLIQARIETGYGGNQVRSDSTDYSDRSEQPTAASEETAVSESEFLFPDLDVQWPRLLYHRHFMLAEFLNDSYQPALPTEASALVGPDLPIDALQQLRQARRRYEAIAGSMANHLKSELGGERVTLQRMEHSLPDFVGYLENGVRLDDPRSFVPLPDEPVSMEELLPTSNGPASPDGVPVSGRPGTRINELNWGQPADRGAAPGNSRMPGRPAAEPVPPPATPDRRATENAAPDRPQRNDANPNRKTPPELQTDAFLTPGLDPTVRKWGQPR